MTTSNLPCMEKKCCEKCFVKTSNGLVHCLDIVGCPCHNPIKEECCENCWGEHDESGRGYCIEKDCRCHRDTPESDRSFTATPSSWEERFNELAREDSEYKLRDKGVQEKLKDLIQSLLQETKQSLLQEVVGTAEGMKYELDEKVYPFEKFSETHAEKDGWNSALKHLIITLTKKDITI